jgi:DNA polymerase-3 subunit delta'
VQIRAESHPDLHYVRKPDDKSFIPLELLIGDKEHRGRQGLCHAIAMKPFMGGRKVAVIDDADYLNPEGANSLLKTLEEPPPKSILILIGTSPAKQLPTIRSRCQSIRFRPLPPEVVAELVVSEGLTEDRAEAHRLALASGGSVRRARELADPVVWTARTSLYQQLSKPRLDSVGLATELLAFMEQSGTEAAKRRDRLRQLALLASDYYATLLRRLTGAPPEGNAEATPWVEKALESWPGDAETAALCAERCLEAAQQIDRNVHPTTLLECWLDDLARTST